MSHNYTCTFDQRIGVKCGEQLFLVEFSFGKFLSPQHCSLNIWFVNRILETGINELTRLAGWLANGWLVLVAFSISWPSPSISWPLCAMQTKYEKKIVA